MSDIKLTLNELEKEILALYDNIYILNEAVKEVKKTNWIVHNIIAYECQLLILKIVGYLHKCKRNNNLYYEENGRTYTDYQKQIILNFYNKYKPYRDMRLAHFDNKEIETPNLMFEELQNIMHCLFNCDMDISTGGTNIICYKSLIECLNIMNNEKIPIMFGLKIRDIEKAEEEDGKITLDFNDLKIL